MEIVSRKVEADEQWLEAMGGPQQWRPADAERVIAAWQASGKSLAAFADDYGIGAQRITWWRKRLASGEPATSSSMEFVPVTVRGAPELASAAAVAVRATVTLTMPGGVRIEVAEPEGVSPAWIAALAGELGLARGAP